jgi:glycosyltransferase involved in cell wall biosynthesis
VVLTLGREEDAKQRELIVDAIAILNRERPVRLAIVGQIRPDHLDRLLRRIDARGVGDVADVTSFVTDREYHEWIESATCAVQLSSHDNGAGSAAVGDAFAAGLPVITNIESCLELPDGTVGHVPSPTDAAAVAREIARVLDDADHRRGLCAGALRYAQSWTVDDVVGRLLEIARHDVDRMAGSRHRVSA